MNVKHDNKTPEYRAGYKAGHCAGYNLGLREGNANSVRKKAHWVMKNYDWYCSNCGTKNEQKHDDYCAKCGAEMNSSEADILKGK